MKRNVPFEVFGTTVHLDGYDRHTRVGFEYLTKDAGDHVEFSSAVLGRGAPSAKCVLESSFSF